MKGLFITGTDTGVGKTFVSCALVRAARAAGHSVFAFKPIETGCVDGVGEDQTALAAAAGDVVRGTYRLALPAAPWVAAQAERVEIDLERIQSDLVAGAACADRVLVEAAGGWRVPITATGDTGALARVCGLPVLVVARAGLGTINHTLLTIDAIQRDELPIAGVVLSLRPDDDIQFADSNAQQICARSGVEVSVWPALPVL
ncbi:dethiobiotin synthase [soil metagenome]